MKQHQQPGFVLHTRPYSESSLLIDVFTREFGRFMLIAKGARRAKRSLRGMLMPFKPLLISWSGRGQLPILTGVETAGYLPELCGNALHSGYYVNELILKLLHRFDEYASLYDYYQRAIQSLAVEVDSAGVLRIFEKQLLKETGFAMILDHDTETGEPIVAGNQYTYLSQQGPVKIEQGDTAEIRIDGATLTALDQEEFTSIAIKNQARSLNRHVIYQQLGGRQLKSRNVLMQVLRYRDRNSR